jgi:hypothetical protein
MPSTTALDSGAGPPAGTSSSPSPSSSAAADRPAMTADAAGSANA